MNQSLSYVLPVKDAQSDLTRQVERLLEMLSDLTPWFELLIVDEQSQDDTSDVAHELSQRYPQVNTTSAEAKELPEMLLTLDQLNGDIVFVADRQAEPEAHDLRELWDMRNDSRLVMARMPRGPENISDELVTRLMGWGEALRDAQARSPSNCVRMVRRSAIMKMGGPQKAATEFAY